MMHKPRIYIAIATFHPLVGGAEKQALMQGRALRERGYATTIVTFRHDWSWPARDEIAGVPVLRVAGLLLGRRQALPAMLQKFFYLLALLSLSWTLWQKRHHYDVLHVYQLNLLTLPTALACYATRKPLIIAVRCATDTIDASDSQQNRHTQRSLIAGPLDTSLPWLRLNERDTVQSDLEDLQRLGKPVVRFIHALLLRIHATVVILSSRMLTYLAAHNFTLPDIEHIPNGVDIARFRPQEHTCQHATNTVVCVSRLSYEKGSDVLLQAWHLVRQRIPSAQLIIVGTGPLQDKLQHMATALGIADSVEFAGVQTNIPAQFQRGNVAILPSRTEGMPNALLEAMACGLSCVATRVSGSEDILQHGSNGLLVEVEDYQGMAEAICTFLQHPDVAQQCGQAARATIERHYALDHIIDRYEQLYQHVMRAQCNKERG